MTSSEIRAEARKSLMGKWGKAALATLVFSILVYVISFVLGFIPFIGGIVSTVISPVLSFGFLVTMMKLKRDTEISYVGFFTDGFNSFGNVWGIIGWTLVKLAVPIILVIVTIVIMIIGLSMSIVSSSVFLATSSSASSSGGFGVVLALIGGIGYFVSLIYLIVKSYLYQLSLYIIADNEAMTAKEAVEESEKLMAGHRWEFFYLQLTFIGWWILAMLTFGIGLFWLMPYIQISSVAFYENLAGKTNTEVQKVDENPEPIQ